MNTIENLHCTISMVLLYFQSLNQWQWSNVFVCGCVYEQSNMRGTTKETYNGTRERKQLKKTATKKLCKPTRWKLWMCSMFGQQEQKSTHSHMTIVCMKLKSFECNTTALFALLASHDIHFHADLTVLKVNKNH